MTSPGHTGQYSHEDDDPYHAQPQNPFTHHMDQYAPDGRTPSPGHPLENFNHNGQYQGGHLDMPVGPGMADDRLQAQPTVSPGRRILCESAV